MIINLTANTGKKKRKGKKQSILAFNLILLALFVIFHISTLANVKKQLRTAGIQVQAKAKTSAQTTNSANADGNDNVNNSGNVPVMTDEQTKRHIILLGPHERFNFGDLLHEKVISNLLMTKLGYDDREIIRAATIPRDMSPHGGYENIISMKQAQNMSRTSPFGPFDIIYTGGEQQTLNSVFSSAVNMLGSPELIALGKAEYVNDCPYLFAKDLLLPLNENGKADSSVRNIAISNGMGDFPGIAECKIAAESADYSVYRDTESLVPDSNVMVKELFGDRISSTLKEIRNSIFPEDENKKYIAVQFEESFDVQTLPQVLDNVAKETNCTIVFFAAGTAPGQDSFEVYQKVVSQMKEPAIVYEVDDVWKTVATIAGAEAVLSSSLDVRIMAFIYLKPRVTWCPSNAAMHENFINLWDAPDMRVCGTADSTWSLLSQYWGETPVISQEKTDLFYKKLIDNYKESFETWGKFLDESNKVGKWIK